jgi:DNA modification methylase
MKAYFSTDNGVLYHGDCLEVIKTFSENSIDSLITDPPYGLSFMGKKWDYDVPSVEIWQECLRVLKPGAHALIFAGSRTQHRMAVNVEDAGFILKDTIMWIYGSGFPKSLDISKACDKEIKNKWTKISNEIDNICVFDIIEAWKNNSNNVNIAEKISLKNQIGIGINTRKKDFAVVNVTRTIKEKGLLLLNAIIAELKSLEADHSSEGSIIIAQGNAGLNTTQLKSNARFAERQSLEQKVCSMNTFIVQCDVKESLNESITDKLKAVEALKIWLGKKKFSDSQAINALCAALTEDLRRIILSQSKTFLNYDTTQQMECVSAINVIITEYTAEHLILYMADILKRKADKMAGKERKVIGTSNRHGGGVKGAGSSYELPPEKHNITAPATPEAEAWNGWGTAIKPAYEIVICAEKPLDSLAQCRIIVENLLKKESQLWLIRHAKLVEFLSESSQVVQRALNIAQWSASQFTSILENLRAQMDMRRLKSVMYSCLNTVSSWRKSLEELCKDTSTSIIKTGINQTIDWKTLSCLLSENTPQDIILAEIKQRGSQLNALPAGKILNAVKKSMDAIRGLSVAADVMSNYQESSQGVAGKTLSPNFEPIIVAMKPNDGSYAQNALKYGVAGLNIDGGRIESKNTGIKHRKAGSEFGKNSGWNKHKNKDSVYDGNKGRFPANIILDEEIIPVLCLTESNQDSILTLDKQQLIEEYYDSYELPAMWKRIQGVSEPSQEWEKKILRQKMLLQGTQRKDERREAFFIREKTQSGSVGKDAPEPQKSSEKREGQPEIQRSPLRQRLCDDQHSGTQRERKEDSIADADQRERLFTGASSKNGHEVEPPTEEVGSSSSQERHKGRQQNREFRVHDEHDPQNDTQRDIEGVAIVEAGKRKIEILAYDVPEKWLRYFKFSGYSLRNPESAAALLDEQSGVLKSGARKGHNKINSFETSNSIGKNWQYTGNKCESSQGGASRFFYCAKASPKDREKFNTHPTVKPLKLMEYLCNLTKTPTGGVVLDPFAGSGTTGLAAHNTQRPWILIEREEKYCEIAAKRIEAAASQMSF